jgi:uncharacterized membrane protein
LTELWPFVGRFHPLLVHFPIGILLLAALLEALAWRRARRRDPSAVDETLASPTGRGGAVTLMLALGAGAAAASATTGYLLGTSGGYGGDTFTRHQAAGFIVAFAACAAAAASLARDRWSSALWRRLYLVSLSVTVVALVLAGHLGATLTHGEGYLTEHAPRPLRALLARVGLGGPAVAAAPALDQALVYGSLVEPVLRARCVACHGAAKAEGELRLDSADGLRKGGQSGPLFTPGRADRSEIVRRLWLPASDPDVMPPAGQRPLSPVEASVVRWWIDRGASFDQKVIDAELMPEVRPAIEAVFGPIERGGPTLPRVTLGAPDRSALAALTASGVSVVPVAAGTPFLHVHATNARLTFDDAAVKRLEPIAAHVLWLDLSDTRVTDRASAQPHASASGAHRDHRRRACAARAARASGVPEPVWNGGHRCRPRVAGRAEEPAHALRVEDGDHTGGRREAESVLAAPRSRARATEAGDEGGGSGSTDVAVRVGPLRGGESTRESATTRPSPRARSPSPRWDRSRSGTPCRLRPRPRRRGLSWTDHKLMIIGRAPGPPSELLGFTRRNVNGSGARGSGSPESGQAGAAGRATPRTRGRPWPNRRTLPRRRAQVRLPGPRRQEGGREPRFRNGP